MFAESKGTRRSEDLIRLKKFLKISEILLGYLKNITNFASSETVIEKWLYLEQSIKTFLLIMALPKQKDCLFPHFGE